MGANALSAEAAAGAWEVCSLMAFLPEEEGWLGGQTHSPDEMERQGLALSGTLGGCVGRHTTQLPEGPPGLGLEWRHSGPRAGW